MLDVSLSGFRYGKFIFDEFNFKKIQSLKDNFDCLHIVCYERGPSLTGFEMQEKQDAIISLKQGLGDIFKSFNSTTRNEIRKTQNIEGLSFVREDENMEEAYNLSKEFDLIRGWAPEPKEQFGKTKLFSAYFDGQTISGITCYDDNNFLRIEKIFSRRLENEKNIKNAIVGYATRRLVYEICEYAKEKGYVHFDLGGISIKEKNKMGIAKFKMCFGAKIKDVGLYKYETTGFTCFRDECRKNEIDIA
ncbi:MAG: hypothetical protein COU51_04005 [Parcubacteria group bacterium CG10_big_fil_rev_8_21_14_0_10_36_14]|nr:MAG: hypothetical protein COU51_04005 [Parcubacteria group bacterium CG10_big_fil_rev_8_21_14_0_10_36_14]